jgi:hypothetical protein
MIENGLEALQADLLELPELRYFVLDRPPPFKHRKTDGMHQRIWKRKYDIQSPTIDSNSSAAKGTKKIGINMKLLLIKLQSLCLH